MAAEFDSLDASVCAELAQDLQLRDADLNELPQTGGISAREPLLVFAGDVDGAVERFGPDEVRGVVVRMADDDADEAAERVDPRDGLVVQQRDAVPEDVAGGGLDEDGALADGELWFGGERCQVGSGGDRRAFVGVAGLDGAESGEGLAGGGDELAG